MTAFDLAAGARYTMEIVLSFNSAEVVGVVRDAGGKPVPNAVASLWTQGFLSQAETNFDGVFHISGVPPGEYDLLAWEGIEMGLDAVGSFRARFAGQAVKVKVGEKDRASVVLPLIRRDVIDAEIAKLP